MGQGLAQALGVGVGATLAVALPNGEERRFEVVGVVRALENDGRVAYVRPGRLLGAAPGLVPRIAVRTAVPEATSSATIRPEAPRPPSPGAP